MPLINVRLSSSNINHVDELLKDLSAELANLTGKPEKYVMCILQPITSMTFGGNEEPSCYVEIKSIGALNPERMTKSFCNLISLRTSIPTNRIYISFEDIEASNWGFNGATFG